MNSNLQRQPPSPSSTPPPNRFSSRSEANLQIRGFPKIQPQREPVPDQPSHLERLRVSPNPGEKIKKPRKESLSKTPRGRNAKENDDVEIKKEEIRTLTIKLEDGDNYVKTGSPLKALQKEAKGKKSRGDSIDSNNSKKKINEAWKEKYAAMEKKLKDSDTAVNFYKTENERVKEVLSATELKLRQYEIEREALMSSSRGMDINEYYKEIDLKIASLESENQNWQIKCLELQKNLEIKENENLQLAHYKNEGLLWKQRFTDIEKEWTEKYQQLEEYTQTIMENKTLLENPLTDKLNKSVLDNQRLKGEISILKDSSLEIEREWSGKYIQMECKLQDTLRERDNLLERKTMTESLMVMISTENERLTGIIAEQDQQYQALSLKLEGPKPASNKELDNKIKELTIESESWRTRIGELEKLHRKEIDSVREKEEKKYKATLDSERSLLNSQIKELETSNQTLRQETIKQSQKLNEKSTALIELQAKLKDLEMRRSDSKNEDATKKNSEQALEKMREEQTNLLMKQKADLLALVQDKDALENQIKEQNQELEFLRSKVIGSENKLREVEKYWRERVSCIENERKRQSELDPTETVLILNGRIDEMGSTIQDLNILLADKEESLNNFVGEFSARILLMACEIERLSSNCACGKSKEESIKRNMNQTSEEVWKLKLEVLQEENNSKAEKIEELTNKLNYLEENVVERANSTAIEYEAKAFENDWLKSENLRLKQNEEEYRVKLGYLELDLQKRSHSDTDAERLKRLLVDRDEQISNLNSKIMGFERELITIQSEKQSLTQQLTSKHESFNLEIEAWKTKYMQMERMKVKEIEDYKCQAEAIRRSQLDRELRDLTLKHLSESKEKDLEINKLRGIIETLHKELDGVKGKIISLEQKIALSQIEQTRLQGLNDDLRDKLGRHEVGNKVEKEGIDQLLKEMREKNIILNRNCEELMRANKEKNEKIERTKLKRREIKENITKVELDKREVSNQIINLKDELRSKENEVQELRARANRDENEKAGSIFELKSLKNERDDWNGEKKRLTADIDEKARDIISYQTRLSEMERMNTENSRNRHELEKQLYEQTATLSDLKEKLKDKEAIIEHKEKKLMDLQEEFQVMNASQLQMGALQKEVVFWQKKLNEQEAQHCEEMARVLESQSKRNLQEAEVEKRNFLIQLEDVSKKNKEATFENEQWREKNSKLNQEKGYFEAKSKEMEQRLNITLIECDEWREKNKENERRLAHLESLAQKSTKNFEEGLSSKEILLEEIKISAKKEKALLQTEIQNLGLEISDKDQKLTQAMLLTDEYKTLLAQRDEEIKEHRNAIIELERSYKTQADQIKRDLESQRRRFIETELKDLNDRYSQDILNLNKKIETLQRENNSLGEKLRLHESDIAEKESERDIVLEECEQWREKFVQVMDENEAMRKNLNDSAQQHKVDLLELQNKISQEFKNIMEQKIRENLQQAAKEKKDLDFQIKNISKENNDLKQQVQNLSKDLAKSMEVSEAEIESWRTKYAEVVRNSEEERSEIQITLKGHLENELEALKALHNSERAKIEKELKQAKDEKKSFEARYKELSLKAEELVKVIHEKDRDLEDNKKRISIMEEEALKKLDLMKREWEINIKGKLEIELKEMLTKLMEEKKIIEVENEKNLNILRVKESELSELRNIVQIKDAKLFELEKKFTAINYKQSDEIEKMKLQFEETIKQKLERELAEIYNKYENERQTNDKLIFSLKDEIKEYEKRISLLKSEASLKSNQEKEIERWRETVNRLELRRVEELEQLRLELNTLKSQQPPERSKYEHDAERNAYEVTIMQLKSKVNEYEISLTHLKKEFEILQNSYSDKSREVVELRSNTVSSKHLMNGEIEELRLQNEQLRRQGTDAKEIIIKLDNERKAYDSQIKQFKMMAEGMKVELERTYALLKERKKERDEAVNQFEIIRNERQKLIFSKDLGNFDEERMRMLKRELDNLTSQRDAYRQQAEKYMNECQVKTQNDLFEKTQFLMEATKSKYI